MIRRPALLAIVAFVLIAIAGAAFTVRMAARAIDETAAAQAAEAPEIARLYIARYGSLAKAAPAIFKHVTRPGLTVIVRDSNTGLMYGPRGVFGQRRGGPFGGPNDRFDDRARSEHRADRMNFVVAILAGENARHVPISAGDVMIFPDPDAIFGVVRSVVAALAVVLACSALSLWLYVRGMRHEAIRPLRETTLSLRRLAQRDFTPRTIVAGEGNAYDELARAYNAAAAAVSSSFAERRAAESEMQRFIADAGHELRTPLTIVMGYLDIIDGGALTDPKIAGRVIAGMRTESARMRKLIDKLIILARMETPSDVDSRDHIDVVALTARVIETLEPLIVHSVDVTGVTFAHVYANEDDLAEALTNIIENGIKYAPLSHLSVDIARTAERVVIAITDRGPGMSSDEARHAFERFYRGEARGDVIGSGLGLAIAKRAVERAAGTIRVQSVPGSGTTFTIELPERPISVGERARLAHR